MRNLYKLFFFILLTIAFTQSYGQSFQQAYQIAGTNIDQLTDITVDNSGNMYAIGTYRGTITVPSSLASGSSTAPNSVCYLFKIDASGTTVWSKFIGQGTSPNRGYKIILDNSGNVIVAGACAGTNVLFDGFASFTDAKSRLNVEATIASDGFVAKYTSAGAVVWIRAIGAAGLNDEIKDVAVDANDNVYVTGFVLGSYRVYGKNYSDGIQTTYVASVPAFGAADIVYAKFSSDGTYQWAKTIGSTGGDDATSIAIDASDNIYISGHISGSVDMDPGAGVATLTESSPQGASDAFIAKYSSSGAYLNSGIIEGVSTENIYRMDIGSSGFLYVAGSYKGTIDADLRAGNSLSKTASGTGYDVFLAKYDLSTFAPSFVNGIGAAADEEANTIKADPSGNIYVTGYITGTSIDFNPGGTAKLLSSAGGKDIFISKYDATGANVWAFSVGNTTDDLGKGIAFNSAGYIFAGGYYSGTSGDFDPGAGTSTLTNLGLDDSYIAKYQECSMPSITGVSPGATVCAGAPLTMTVTVTGSGITYQWKKNGSNVSNGGTVSGATSATLSISSSVAGDAGTYTCVVSSCGNNLTSGNVVMIVNTPPSITTQPSNVSICTGQSTSLAVVASGTSLSYQWQKNGSNISNGAIYSGVNAATLNIVNATASEAGNYTCIVSGSCPSSVTSSTATLTISTGITITTQPAATSACVGGNASISVAATGSGLTYQWQKNSVNISDGGSISGATTSALAITGVVAGDAANYRVVISGGCASTLNSNAAALTITTAPVITTHPTASQTLCSGQALNLSVVSSGSGLSYQWKKNGSNLSNGGTVSGATSAALSISAVTLSDAGTYTCVVTGACAPIATSNNAVVSVNSLPAISTEPVAHTICSGQNTSFSVMATGTGITYQWQKNNVNITDGGVYSGTSTATLTITAAAVSDAGNYRCIVSGTCSPSATSASVPLTVNSSASITAGPADLTVCAGQTATFSITTSGSGITYQWQKNAGNLTNGGGISGATSSILSIASASASDAGNYTCIITNTCSGTQTSSAAILAINTLPVITAQPTDATICGSTNVTFTVIATGTSLTYQWKKSGVNISDGGIFSGATTATLSISPASASEASTYTCVVSGACSPSVTSNPTTLSVGTAAAITTEPINTSVCSGANASFSVGVSGTGITYQWRKDGINLTNGGKISGATSASLTITGATAADIGDYSVITGNTCSGTLTSANGTLAIDALPAITSQPSSTSVCSGSPASFSITATGKSVTYQWRKGGMNLTDGGNISGAGTSTLTITSAISGDAGTYDCVVSGACSPSVTSTAVTLSISSGATIITQPVNTTACTGLSTVLTCQATGGSITYQWKKNGTALTDGGNITGSSSFTLSINPVSPSDAGTYICDVTSSCSGTIPSNSAVITVTTSASITTQPSDVTICSGTNASFSVVASGTGLTYQWKKDGINLSNTGSVSGATTADLVLASASPSDNGTYTCSVTGACNTVLSSGAVLNVSSITAITTQPADQSACSGDNVTMTVVATGANLTYQWKKNGVDLADVGNVSGSGTSVLSVGGVSISDAGNYSVTVSGTCGSPVLSSFAVLSLDTPPIITSQPSDKLACNGQTIVLSLVVSNASGVTFKWEKDGVPLSDGGNISGATTSDLSIASVTNADAGSYICIVKTACSSSLNSVAATVTVTSSSAITGQPVNANICKTQSATFFVSVSSAGVTYQWQFKPSSGGAYTNLSNGGKISGATTGALTVTNADLAEQGSYKCIVSEPCGASQTSAAAALIINSPNIVQHPFPQSLCPSQQVIFDVVALGQNLSYQWFKDGVALVNGGRFSGTGSASLKITALTVLDQGDYTCTVTGICAPPQTSDPATLTVACTPVLSSLQDPDIRIYPKPTASNSTIEFKNRNGAEAVVTIFNSVGSLIWTNNFDLGSDLEQYTLPMESLPIGMYIIQIQIDQELFTDKLERIP